MAFLFFYGILCDTLKKPRGKNLIIVPLICIRKPFYPEEGHSILTETSFLHKFFSQWQQVFCFNSFYHAWLQLRYF